MPMGRPFFAAVTSTLTSSPALKVVLLQPLLVWVTGFHTSTTQFVTVQRGCDYRCTYCIVPYTRGAERSRKLGEVLRETRQVVADGMSEVVLLGQTVNSYNDGEHDFADLLRAVGEQQGGAVADGFGDDTPIVLAGERDHDAGSVRARVELQRRRHVR